MNWINDIDNYGMKCVYVELEADGFTYELLVTSSKIGWVWELYTTEIFESDNPRITHTVLAEGRTSTMELGKCVVYNAFCNREKYRKNCIEFFVNAA